TFINKNTFIFDHVGLGFQGSYGSAGTDGSGHQNLQITNNTFESRTEETNEYPITVRFFHGVHILGNDYRHSSGDKIFQMVITANKNVVVSDNILHTGNIHFNTATTNQQGASFTDKFKS